MPAYGTLAELKAEMQKTDTGDDTILQVLLDDATVAINNLCHRPDGFVAHATATTRTFAGQGRAWLYIDECAAIDAVSVKDSPTDTTYVLWVQGTDYTFASGDPRFPDFNCVAKGQPYTFLLILPEGEYSTFLNGAYTDDDDCTHRVPTVQVTAHWGYATVCPSSIRRACLIQAARWYKKMQSAGADTGANANLGTLTYGRILDGDIEALLKQGRYIREAIG